MRCQDNFLLGLTCEPNWGMILWEKKLRTELYCTITVFGNDQKSLMFGNCPNPKIQIFSSFPKKCRLVHILTILPIFADFSMVKCLRVSDFFKTTLLNLYSKAHKCSSLCSKCLQNETFCVIFKQCNDIKTGAAVHIDCYLEVCRTLFGLWLGRLNLEIGWGHFSKGCIDIIAAALICNGTTKMIIMIPKLSS